jgi:hypothetical protein
MAQVGVQSLRARHREEDRAEHAEAAVPVARQELERISRAYRQQDARCIDDAC